MQKRSLTFIFLALLSFGFECLAMEPRSTARLSIDGVAMYIP